MIRVLRSGPSALAVLVCALAVPAAAVLASAPGPLVTAPPAQTTPANGGADAAGDADDGLAALRQRDVCAYLLSVPWPRGASDRRGLLQRFDAARTNCIGHAAFLAAYGALWLEEGEPAQALLWLERSLLLDPDQLGAQADHALALAALGDTSARDSLAARWLQRLDVPPALRERLALAQLRRGPTASDGEGAAAAGPRWLIYREATLVAGHETNLDHSPRLSEITLTPPEGPIELPLLEPIVPRRGSAYLADLSIQLAHSPRAGLVLQTGLLASARHSSDESATDWHHLQWAASASQRWGGWRGQAQLSATAVGGATKDNYRLWRAGLAAEREAVGCGHRLALEVESRRHRDNTRADGRSRGLLLNSLCPLFGTTRWTWGAATRFSRDAPPDPERPGGTQQQVSLGLRVAGPLPGSFRLEAGFRSTRLTDQEGYSPLLENNARRRIDQTHLTAELSRPWGGASGNGTEWLLQLQRTRQDSNLVIFKYEGSTAFAGLRKRW